MGLKKKKQKKINLLEMSDDEKIKVIRKVKEKLQQKIVEAKLWKSFVEAENLTINGAAIQCEYVEFKGLSLNEILNGR